MATGGPTDRFLFFFPSLSLSLLNAHTHKHRHTFSFSFFPPSLLSSLFICSHNREGGGGKGKKKKAGVGRGILVALQDWVWYCAVLLYCQTLWNTSSGLFLIFFFFFFFPGVVFFLPFLLFCVSPFSSIRYYYAVGSGAYGWIRWRGGGRGK